MMFSLSPTPSDDLPLLFLPGWGFDARLVHLYRLFPGRRLLLPDTFLDPASMLADLTSFLHHKNIGRLDIVGWSMGAQLGLDFCLAHPALVGRLELLAMRSAWPQLEINAGRQGVSRDLYGYMREFYRRCFLGYKRPYEEFQLVLLDHYLAGLDRTILLAGLDYLAGFVLPEALPAGPQVTILHGRKDLVAPISSMPQLACATRKILPHAGHMVLLDPR